MILQFLMEGHLYLKRVFWFSLVVMILHENLNMQQIFTKIIMMIWKEWNFKCGLFII